MSVLGCEFVYVFVCGWLFECVVCCLMFNLCCFVVAVCLCVLFVRVWRLLSDVWYVLLVWWWLNVPCVARCW